jgi:hypothetical protein
VCPLPIGGSPIPYTMLPFDNYYTQPAYTAAPKPARPVQPASRPNPPVRVDIPPPGALGIAIQEPPVTVPPPGDIGIKLDRP